MEEHTLTIDDYWVKSFCRIFYLNKKWISIKRIRMVGHLFIVTIIESFQKIKESK